jgi:hypothetical protein
MTPTMLDAVARGSSFRSVDTGVVPIPFDAGNAVTRKLPQGNLLKNLTLRLTGNLVVAAAPGTLVGNESPLGLIQRIEIVTDTNRVLWSADAKQLFRYAHFMYGKQNELVAPALAIGTNPFAATISLPQEALRFVRPVETYFNTRRYQETNIRVSWGTAANLSSTGTLSITACQLDVIAATTTTGFGLQRFDKIISSQVIPVTATNQSLDQLVPKNGHLARILLSSQRADATVDDIINRVSLIGDTSYRMRDGLAWRTMQQKNLRDYQLDGALVVGNQIPGYAMIDLSEDGMFASLINTFDLNELILRLDVTFGAGVQRVNVLYEFFEPLREALESGAVPAA